ncbi:CLUMA_CG016392, isoform A [Clunio marinus]|uniref:CLUMA_CG016392, isoform A n=1 Tax=Clunio marinus TaxID=568069 RepID=A0A1J1ITW1_9DIPT|nr:CLUMA_CG016392, isoform A [Clunio marinus]
MNQFSIWILFAVISLTTKSCLGLADLNKPPKYCIMERAHRMVGYNCAKLELRDVPKYLKSSTEVLDLSQNRIRELTRESFAALDDLKFLYIFDNMINRIEDDTFAMLTNLEALDLSGNGLLDVPPEIFNLPLLRNLYLADNSFGDRGFETLEKIRKPIMAPLKVLSIANNRLYKIPDFGILPELYKLNVSSNPMRDLAPQQFSPFCNIKEVDLNNTSMAKCRCEEVTRFLYQKREVYLLSSFYCDAMSSECKFDVNVTFAETKDYQECLSIRREVIEHKKAQLTWGIIAGGVVGFLVFFISCLYCLHRRNVRQMNRKSKKLNNQHMKVAKKVEVAEAAEENINTSPEKLLIKRSEV